MDFFKILNRHSSSDTSRSSICGINFENLADGDIRLTATDGNSLLSIRMDGGFFFESFSREFGFKFDDNIKQAILYTDKKQRQSINKSNIVETEDSIYPKYRQLIPTVSLIPLHDADFHVAFSPKALKICSDTAKDLGIGKQPVPYWCVNQVGPTLFNTELFGDGEKFKSCILLLMPIHQSKSTATRPTIESL